MSITVLQHWLHTHVQMIWECSSSFVFLIETFSQSYLINIRLLSPRRAESLYCWCYAARWPCIHISACSADTFHLPWDWWQQCTGSACVALQHDVGLWRKRVLLHTWLEQPSPMSNMQSPMEEGEAKHPGMLEEYSPLSEEDMYRHSFSQEKLSWE